MKLSVFVACLVCVSGLAGAADAEKVIVVDETRFSDIYPAVWFSPSTGEITPLKERSQNPPEEKYEIWIEPRDPEFGYNPDKKPLGVGFAEVGKGQAAFEAPELSRPLKLKLKITHFVS